MAQEFTINSNAIEDKINQLLPSQGGFGAGIDFSASTMVIPIVDLTESAEGSKLRQDLQTAISNSLNTVTIANTAGTDIVTTTGFYRVYISNLRCTGAGTQTAALDIDDGTSNFRFFEFLSQSGVVNDFVNAFDSVVFLKAGSKIDGTAGSGQIMRVHTYQIASIDGNLTNPLGF